MLATVARTAVETQGRPVDPYASDKTLVISHFALVETRDGKKRVMKQ